MYGSRVFSLFIGGKPEEIRGEPSCKNYDMTGEILAPRLPPFSGKDIIFIGF
jgi:hypothetical protein